MQPYLTFKEILFQHFMMGVGFSIIYTIWVSEHGYPRKMFVFGGSELSLGEKKQWYKWLLAAWVFEFLTSFLYFRQQDFYWEVAMSPLEAALMTFGFFLTDRVIRFWDLQPELTSTTEPKPSKEETSKKKQETRDNENQNFESVIRGR